MSLARQSAIISEDEYLNGEIISEVKHEYVDGEVYAMAGASMNHERIANNVLRKLGNHLENSPCEPFGSDLKVRTPAGNYRYPDVMVVCDSIADNALFSATPVILVEVISRSTRKTDEQTKRLEYMNIPTLKEYVMIEQDYVDICVLRKNQHWQPTHYFLGDDITFEAVDLTLPVAEIYHRVVNQDMTEWLESLPADEES